MRLPPDYPCEGRGQPFQFLRQPFDQVLRFAARAPCRKPLDTLGEIFCRTRVKQPEGAAQGVRDKEQGVGIACRTPRPQLAQLRRIPFQEGGSDNIEHIRIGSP